MKLSALLVSIAFVFVAAGADKDSAKEEMKKLQGTWTMIKGEFDGKAIPEEDVKTASLVIKGNHHTVHVGKLMLEGTQSIDPSKDPKTIDGTDIGADGKKTKTLGIYKLDGDVFEVCFSPAGKDRPTKFATEPESGKFMHQWKRTK